MLAKTVTEAARFVAERGLLKEGAPILLKFVTQVAARFGLVVTQKVAAQALPLVGALLITALPSDGKAEQRNARWIALWTTLVTFAISLILLYRFDPTSFEFQFVEKQPWLGGAITYHMGVDGISLPFVVLTTGLMPVCIIASWNPIQRRVKEYMIAFLVL